MDEIKNIKKPAHNTRINLNFLKNRFSSSFCILFNNFNERIPGNTKPRNEKKNAPTKELKLTNDFTQIPIDTPMQVITSLINNLRKNKENLFFF
jgi:hypothetical protein